MFQKTKDVVMTIGFSIIQKSKQLYNDFLTECRDTARKTTELIKRTAEKAIEGEYLGKGGVAVGTVAVATFSGSALAAVPVDVTTAITTAATDVAIVGAAVVVVMVGIKVFKWLIRAL